MLMSVSKVDDVCAEKQVKYKYQANHQKQINETLSLCYIIMSYMLQTLFVM